MLWFTRDWGYVWGMGLILDTKPSLANEVHVCRTRTMQESPRCGFVWYGGQHAVPSTPLWMSSAHLHSIASSCISVPICLCMLNCTLEEQLPWKGISVITPKNWTALEQNTEYKWGPWTIVRCHKNWVKNCIGSSAKWCQKWSTVHCILSPVQHGLLAT